MSADEFPKSMLPDPALANAQMVRSSLAAMQQSQEAFFSRLESRIGQENNVLLGRLEIIDSRLDDYNRELKRMGDLIEELNRIVAGVRSAGESTYNMATTATRELGRMRKFLKIPDASDAEVQAHAASAAASNQAPAGDGAARPVR